jgi:diguanylate cyclase (GGDEF)-like protein/PAS domain S-box-containing protein
MKAHKRIENAIDALGDTPVDAETRERYLDLLLERDPPPLVTAMGENGLAVGLPAAVPVRPGKHLDGIGAVFDACLPSQHADIIRCWERARLVGIAHMPIRLRGTPELAVTLYIVDARMRFGIFLGMISSDDGLQHLPTLAAKPFRPRQCTIERDGLAMISAVDDAFSKILGWSAAELVGRRSLELVHPDDRPQSIATWMAVLAHPDLPQRSLARHRHKDGAWVWFESTHYNRLGAPEAAIVSEIVDVSDRMEALEALRKSEQLLRRITEALPVGIVQIDAHRRIVYVNERLSTIVGAGEAETIDEQFAGAAPADRLLFDTTLDALLTSGVAADIEVTLDGPRGSRRFSVGLRALTAGTGSVTGAIACIADITEGVRLREELRTRATFDDLTHCRNRSAILETLESVLERPKHVHHGVAVVFIDLDRFKDVNDRLGHAAGDELLRRVGERLTAETREGDVVGRLGGDEFLIVCPNVASPQAALEIATRIAVSVAQRTDVGAETIVPASSIGVAWSDGSIDADTFVARADTAMYESKRLANGPVLSLA